MDNRAALRAPGFRRRPFAATVLLLGQALHLVLTTLVRWVRPRWRAILGVGVVALVGGAMGAALAPSTTAQVGPLTAEVRVVPSLEPGVRLLLPPAGEVDFPTHRAPFAIEGSIAQVDLEGARELVESPTAVRELGESAPAELRSAVIRAALVSLGCAFAGALLLSVLVWRLVWKRSLEVAATLAGALLVTGGMAAVSADPDKLAQPRFSGLLSQAPYIAGSVPGVLDRLETYRSGLADIVRSVTALYATSGALPTLSTENEEDVVKVLHVSDVHLNPLAFDLMERLVDQFGVDVIVDTGDITTWGTELESSTLSRIGDLKVPYVFVRGNHDSGRTARAVARQKNAIVLDDEVKEVAGLRIAGIGDPVFTPEQAAAPTSPSNTLPGPATPRSATPTASSSPSAPGPAPSTTPTPTTTATGPATPSGPQGESNTRLSTTIQAWDAENPDQPVEIAAVHEPYQLEPLLGRVPTILAGHTHKRETRADDSGTRIMIEGSTGGAGITSRGLVRLAEGEPLPLSASIVYVARRGPQAGQVVATDAITVGGFGLTSVNLERSTFREATALEPVVTPSPTPTPAPTSTP